MILSVSRRTDIPAFYSNWFFKRLEENFFLVRNPMNTHQISKVSLDASVIDCIVFWTKNPKPMIDNIDIVEKKYGINSFYFQYTLNAYEKDLEPHVVSLEERILSFKRLAKRIGKNKVVWRYDPIVLTDKYNLEFHKKAFETLLKELAPYTNRCVISFVDLYDKTKRNMSSIKYLEFTNDIMIELASFFAEKASAYNISVESCSEAINLDAVNVKHTHCIDAKLITEILGVPMDLLNSRDKDKNQRQECGCVNSIDMGTYNTCKHGCRYCYANFNKSAVINNCAKHLDDSPLLIGDAVMFEGDKITERKMKSYKIAEIEEPLF